MKLTMNSVRSGAIGPRSSYSSPKLLVYFVSMTYSYYVDGIALRNVAVDEAVVSFPKLEAVQTSETCWKTKSLQRRDYEIAPQQPLESIQQLLEATASDRA